MKLITGEFEEELRLQFAPAIRAGFPSPAEDYMNDSLDFNRDLIRHPEATFYGRVEGESMIGLGINDGDIAVIDRSIEAEHGDVVVAFINNEFNVKLLDLTHQKEGFIELRSANPKFPSFRIDEEDQFQVWGVVIWTIKKWK
ncbi:MAG: translesion error-prone DNA polymerase V autoproteolytic subunit [Prevotella sp.]|nr:translesion error-prone DNA polymerase V autoproteolytic subunit [Prevotella sp.]